MELIIIQVSIHVMGKYKQSFDKVFYCYTYEYYGIDVLYMKKCKGDLGLVFEI